MTLLLLSSRDGPVDRLDQCFSEKWLGEAAVRSPRRNSARTRVVVSRDEDRGQRVFARQELLVQIDARHPRKPDVQYEAVSPQGGTAREKRFRPVEYLGHESLRLQNASDGLAHRLVVLDDRHGLFRLCGHDE